MPTVNPTCFHVSASSVAAFKACPTRFRLQYREGIRQAVDMDSQRVGTNWHAMHEAYANTSTIDAVVEHLNKAYAERPNYKTAEEWELERTILFVSFVAYQWYYSEDPLEFLASELPFELPLRDPRVGLPLSTKEVLCVGKIDHIVRWQGAICNLERKSTSRSISDDSDYWDKAKKDTQVSMYAMAFRDMGLYADQGRAGNTLYDVWHKPTIKPTDLTQKETAEFIASGEYQGQKFEVALTEGEPHVVTVNGVNAEVTMGKKGFAVKETVDMFGARLLQDMYARPEFYFRRKEIARTDADITHFRGQLYAVYQAMKNYSATGHWFENESQCRATFACPYIPICYGPGATAVCDGKTTPNGFRRIFVDLTINGQAIEE